MKGKIKWNKLLAFFVLAVFLIGSYGTYTLLILSRNNPATQNSPTATTKPEWKDKILIFYLSSCPHCHDLQQQFKQNKIEDKLNNVLWLKVDNVPEDKYNTEIYVSKVAECGLGEESYVVPFAYHQGKCYLGSDQIWNYVNSLLKAK